MAMYMYVFIRYRQTQKCMSERPRRNSRSKVDTFDAEVIRRSVHSFYRRKEFPTVNKVQQYISDTIKISHGTVWNEMKKLGFVYGKTDSDKKVICENVNVCAERAIFLRKIKHYREMGLDVVYTDETWVNAHHCRSRQWKDKSSGQAARIPPSSRGQRLIILHAGSARHGFIHNCDHVFESTKTGDYHENMDGKTFMAWFQTQLLPTLEEPCVIVQDNASYHNLRVPETIAPTSNFRKQVMIDWLQEKGIHVDPLMLKPEIYKVVKKFRSGPQYLTDKLAAEHGHFVLRTPVRHWIFNAIEIIWSIVKDKVAVDNKTEN